MERVSYSRNVSLKREAKENVFILIPAINKERVIYFPFGSVGNGDYFCFDLENNWVVIYIHELQKFRYVCDSFEELLGMMDQNERNEF